MPENFPIDYQDQQKYWQKNAQFIINSYTSQKSSFLFGCHPKETLKMPTAQIIYILTKRFGDEKVRFCLNPHNTYDSPIVKSGKSDWIKKVNMVGVNVRTIGSFWQMLKYALTLPNQVSSIHLLPIWECGVVASLYGIASWHINSEFFDGELAGQFPHLNTIENQLKVTINLLHLMGKTVGFDVVPHTDRYSEITLANPFYFEWLLRKDFEILDHSENLTTKVADRILAFVAEFGAASGDYFPRLANDFFDNSVNNEEVRLRILFGKKENIEGRNSRRNQLINFLFEKGYEPAPATMAPPYRGLMVDPSETAKTVDSDGHIWRDYLIEKPQSMSRVFGPLARYKFYETKDNNLNWEFDFDKPRAAVFDYLALKYFEVSEKYNFDFMRGDMSHVQMNPNINENQLNQYYDIHKFVKNSIQNTKPYFAYFAESFLVEDNLMAYGNEADHLNRSDTDSSLGNLQSYSLRDFEFYKEFVKYFKLAKTNDFVPNFTIFTADKDDPRFDIFYLEGNAVRYFVGIFFKFFPSYNSLGFEIRDLHYSPAPNEYYTKLYVFHVEDGPKHTNGPYQWGTNGELFNEIQQINQISDIIFNSTSDFKFTFISNLESLENERYLEWTLEIGIETFLFVAVLFLKNESMKYMPKLHPNASFIFGNNCEKNSLNTLKMNAYSYAIFKV